MRRAAFIAGLALAMVAVWSSGALAGCSDPAGPAVNWEGCNKQSASLSDVDLSGANLRNVDFRDADMRRANLSGADITGAKLSHADLSRTIWTDGRICAIASDGDCE